MAIEVLIATTFLGFVSVFGTAGNSLVLLTVASTRSLRNANGIIMAALAVSDLFTSCVLTPMTMASFAQDGGVFRSSSSLCRLYGALFIQSGAASIFCMSATALNRYACVCHNGHYKKWASKKLGLAAGVACHVCAACFSLPPLVGFSRYYFIDGERLCLMYRRESGYHYLLFLAVFTFAIPFTVIVLSYFKIWRKVSSSQQQVASHHPWQTTSAATRRDIDIAKSLFVIFLVYCACMTPYQGWCTFNPAEDAPFGMATMFLANSALNPIVYWTLNPQYRRAIRRVICRAQTTAVSTIELGPVTSFPS